MADSDYSPFPSVLIVWKAIRQPYIGNPSFSPNRLSCWARGPEKIDIIRIGATLSRQPLVKGERLVRYEVIAAMDERAVPSALCFTLHPTLSLRPLNLTKRQAAET